MKWVEKSSIEKIRRLLEISERERHYQVLLTRENISAVRHNPAPYTFPVIPRSLPSNVVEGEHFVLADVRRLVSGNASSSRDLVVEASSRVQGDRSASRSPASSSRGSDLSLAADRGVGWHGLECILPLTQVARAAPRVVKVKRKKAPKRRNALGSRCENFVPWVPDDTDGPQDLEEEERMEKRPGLLDRYAARKRKRQVSSSGESDAALSHLQDRAGQLPMMSLLLTEVRGIGRSPSLVPPSWVKQVAWRRTRMIRPHKLSK